MHIGMCISLYALQIANQTFQITLVYRLLTACLSEFISMHH